MRTAILAVAATLALTAPAGAATRNFGIESFTKIRIEGPYKVTLTTGVAPFARATGSAAGLDRVAVDVEGDTLVVHTGQAWGGYPGSDPGPVVLDIGTHDLVIARVNGAGSIAIDHVTAQSFALALQGSGAGSIGTAAVDDLSVNLQGSSSAKVAGRAGKLSVLVRGVSSLDAAGLTTPNAAISADGTATIDATVTDAARIDAWGPATIRLTGHPTCTVKANGSTTISGCR